MSDIVIPAYIRGELIEGPLVQFGGRDGDTSFKATDPAAIVDLLPLGSPARMNDLYALSFDEVVEYLAELGRHLEFERNPHLQVALEASLPFTDMTEPVLRRTYTTMHRLFDPVFVRECAEAGAGIDHLDGWVDSPRVDGRTLRIRAMGARSVHVVAGNSAHVSGVTIMRNAITRGDAIIKVPSNDPLTALAIARTMRDMAPDHALTKHLSVAYWKGGSEEFEQQIYRPQNIEKIMAWGGFASMKHVTRYIQPGLELISMDPKLSSTIIGPEAFESEETMREVAIRAAADMGTLNQLGCVCARVMYVVSGTDEAGLTKLGQLGRMIYEALLALPESISTKPKEFNRELKSNMEAARLSDDWYHVIGGSENEGAVIVSQTSEPVEFSPLLSGRVSNLVPIDSVSEAVKVVNAYTQTIGIYPESLKTELRETLALHGAQRLVSLGYAANATLSMPQDALEPVRRMCKWIVDDCCSPETVKPVWEPQSSVSMETVA